MPGPPAPKKPPRRAPPPAEVPAAPRRPKKPAPAKPDKPAPPPDKPAPPPDKPAPPPDKPAPPPDDPTPRAAPAPAVDWGVYPPNVDRWALVVGISQYRDRALALDFADRDATELHALLQQPSCGGFRPEKMLLLTNEQATTAGVTAALRSFLKKPAREDVVVLFFAAHGASDPDRPDIVYLLTHDTDPDDIAATALPMREIQVSLGENLLAERVILFADTCRSGTVAATGGLRGGPEDGKIVNRYLLSMSRAGKGMAVLTSAEATEVAREDAKWGGGHGVFTHFLLEGMRGAADRAPRTGVVRLGQLFEYVRENVQRATDDKQHPVIGPTVFDRELPVAVTAAISAQEHLAVGRALYAAADEQGDPFLFRAAAAQIAEAVRLARFTEIDEARAGFDLGRALWAGGDLEAAAKAFASGRPKPRAEPPETPLLRGAVLLAGGKAEEGKKALEGFVRGAGASPWATLARGMLEERPRWGLIVCPSAAASASGRPDAERMQDLLRALGFPRDRVITLFDQGATHAAILAAFADLAARIEPAAEVFVYLAGSAHPDEAQKEYIAVLETGGRLGTLTVDEVADGLKSLGGSHKLLVLECMSRKALVQRIEEDGYSAFLATAPGEYPYYVTGLTQGGVFTKGLWKVLLSGDAAAALSTPELVRRVTEEIRAMMLAQPVPGPEPGKPAEQKPIWVGPPSMDVLRPGKSWADFVAVTQRASALPRVRALVESRYAEANASLPADFPDLHAGFGEALFAAGSTVLAAEAFARAAGPPPAAPPAAGEHGAGAHVDASRTPVAADPVATRALFGLVTAHLARGRHGEAAAVLRRLAAATKAEEQAGLAEVQKLTDELASRRRFALLVQMGAPSDGGAIDRLARGLRESQGFSDQDITTLRVGERDTGEVHRALAAALKGSNKGYGLFFLEVTTAPSAAPPAPGAAPPPAGPAPRRRPAKPRPGASGPGAAPPGEVASSPGPGERALTRADLAALLDALGPTAAGAPLLVAIDHPAFTTSVSASPKPLGEFSMYSVRGVGIRDDVTLAGGLARAIEQIAPAEWTYASLVAHTQASFAMAYRPGAEVEVVTAPGTGQKLTVPRGALFGAELQARAEDKLRALRLAPQRDAVAILERLLEGRQNASPDLLLALGVLHAETGDTERALSALEQAASVSGARPGAAVAFHLGRLLLETRRDVGRAVNLLRAAAQAEPTHAGARYYLGKAIQVMVAETSLVQAGEAWTAYEQLGSPLGHTDEVNAFLRPQGTRPRSP